MRQGLPENDGKSDYHIGCGQGWLVRVVNAKLDCVADGIRWLNGEGLFDASRPPPIVWSSGIGSILFLLKKFCWEYMYICCYIHPIILSEGKVVATSIINQSHTCTC